MAANSAAASTLFCQCVPLSSTGASDLVAEPVRIIRSAEAVFYGKPNSTWKWLVTVGFSGVVCGLLVCVQMVIPARFVELSTPQRPQAQV